MLKAIEYRINTQRLNREDLPVYVAQSAGQLNVFASYNLWNDTTNDKQTSIERPKAYDTEYSEDAGLRGW